MDRDGPSIGTGSTAAPRPVGGAAGRTAVIAAAAVIVAGLGFFVITALSGVGTAGSGSAGRGGVSYRVPEAVLAARKDVREAYEFAIARPDAEFGLNDSGAGCSGCTNTALIISVK